MSKKNLVILNNEKVFSDENNFYCDDMDVKSIPEGLALYNDVFYISRSLKKRGKHKLNLKNIKVASNIFAFLYYIFNTFKIKNNNYLLISISPYTFVSFLFLRLFRKKVFVYLRSSGHEEYKHIIGPWAVIIYDLMYKIVTFKTNVIVVDYRLHNKEKKSHLARPSKLDSLWLSDNKEATIDQIKLLYVGRINPEKGILEFLKMLDQLELKAYLSIVSNVKNLKVNENKVKLLGHGFDTKSLINIYDDNNIIILPSFTEGHPQVVDEALARGRPVVIFEDISHIIQGKKGIFISKRNIVSLSKTLNYIMKNYRKIEKDIKKNILPTREDFVKSISSIIETNS